MNERGDISLWLYECRDLWNENVDAIKNKMLKYQKYINSK